MDGFRFTRPREAELRDLGGIHEPARGPAAWRRTLEANEAATFATT